MLDYNLEIESKIGIDHAKTMMKEYIVGTRNLSGQALLGRKVSTGGTVEEHRIYFAVDKDGDGFVDRAEGAPVTKVRAKAITWCAGADGGLGDCTSTASMKASLNGRMITNADNVYSWQRGQEAR